MGIWVVCLIFYFYVRMAKTMDLGAYLAYGIFVLVVEVRALAVQVRVRMCTRDNFGMKNPQSCRAHRGCCWVAVIVLKLEVQIGSATSFRLPNPAVGEPHPAAWER